MTQHITIDIYISASIKRENTVYDTTEIPPYSKEKKHRIQSISRNKKNKGTGKIIPVHDMKAYGGTAPRILRHEVDTGGWLASRLGGFIAEKESLVPTEHKV